MEKFLANDRNYFKASEEDIKRMGEFQCEAYFKMLG